MITLILDPVFKMFYQREQFSVIFVYSLRYQNNTILKL